MSHPLFEQHRATLDRAVEAIHVRDHWSAYPEIPSGKIYGETAKDDGKAAWEGRLGRRFEIDQPGTTDWIGSERSPYGPALGITYPKPDLDTLLPAVACAQQGWREVPVETRIGVCLEILARLNRRSFEIAQAVQHTTGQGGMMAFQAGGPHAQDRGLEAVAVAWDELRRIPGHTTWTKQVGKEETVTLRKTYRVVPRGVAVTIGCSTFPTWNGYPGIFASLATGNAVVVKPHPGAIAPLAITVEIGREVLAEHGFDPNILVLAADTPEEPVAKSLVSRPEVGIVDYTGSSEFGAWIEDHARQAAVFTEKAGVNSVIIDSVAKPKPMMFNLAFTVSLYSGQMCTASQNIFVPADGIATAEGRMSFDEVAEAFVGAVDGFLSDSRRAAEVLGAIQNEATAARVDAAADEPGVTVLRPSRPVENEAFPDARIRSPLVLQVDADREDLFMREMFGPIVYVVKTRSTEESIELAARAAKERGGITCAVYSTDPDVLGRTEAATADAGVPLSCNLTGSIWVNQAAAFSDFHVSGANPAGNATLCDAAFVTRRFSIVQSRIPVSAA